WPRTCRERRTLFRPWEPLSVLDNRDGHTIERLGAGVHGDVFLVPVGLVLARGHESNQHVVTVVCVDERLQVPNKGFRGHSHSLSRISMTRLKVTLNSVGFTHGALCSR